MSLSRMPSHDANELREQLASLQALLALSMRMTDTEDREQILHLAATVIPSLSSCHFFLVHVDDDSWFMTGGTADGDTRAGVEAQLAVVGSAGGAVAVGQHRWGWAYPLRSLGGHFGYLVVGAETEPPVGEQFLLRVLAQQAGVALANAGLHARQRRQAADLMAANSRLAETVAALERNTAIHERLTRVALAGEGQEGIAGALHALTGLAVSIEDRYGNLRAWAGPGLPVPYPKESPGRRAAMLRQAAGAAGPVRYNGQLMVVVAHSRDEVLGVLALVDPGGQAGDEARLALEHGATVLAMELARVAAIGETELRLRGNLVDELLAGIDESSAIARAEALGYDLERPHRVVVVDADVPDRQDLFHAVRRAARDCGVGTLLALRGQSVVVLADTDRPWETFRAAVQEHLNGRPCRVGVGSRSDSVSDLPGSHREALVCGRLQVDFGRDQALVYDELGVYRLFAGVGDVDSIERFVRMWLGDLIDYDRMKEASDLVTTLGRYLDNGGNYDATARALAVHRSTLKYRLQRIRDISGHDLASVELRFNLQLAVAAWRTVRVVRGDTPLA